MIDLSTLTNILETHKLTDEQSEELQKVIYGLGKGKIIELANMPTKGDMAYTIFSTVGDYARIIPVKYLGCFRSYPSRCSNDYVLKFVFVDAASELMKKDIADFTADDMYEVYIFDADEIGEKFFFKESEAIKVFHSFCNLTEAHINVAKECIGFNEAEINTNAFKAKRNLIWTYQDDKVAFALFKCGIFTLQATVICENNQVAMQLSPMGRKWLSIMTDTNIQI